eukprot:586656-Rhodomonas_salina.1
MHVRALRPCRSRKKGPRDSQDGIQTDQLEATDPLGASGASPFGDNRSEKGKAMGPIFGSRSRHSLRVCCLFGSTQQLWFGSRGQAHSSFGLAPEGKSIVLVAQSLWFGPRGRDTTYVQSLLLAWQHTAALVWLKRAKLGAAGAEACGQERRQQLVPFHHTCS